MGSRSSSPLSSISMSLHPFQPTAEAEQNASPPPMWSSLPPLHARTQSPPFALPRVGRVEAAAKGQDWHAAEAVERGIVIQVLRDGHRAGWWKRSRGW